ncbi:anthranilate synthase component II [Reinekea marinisedimentorum]|uniref:Anthranilate synthase component 2 n=1 Tax=Reinekea marinisedimentorum TaxID=230495 RepID=A0A4R3HTG5_9GAMM|nr:aminodeoxychorismate/anthranilate synthase component II [Reinekea marinisedimentorum]TCS36457.1 anthranilate synthase component 2 [Reinekea marinisedimentorum]
MIDNYDSFTHMLVNYLQCLEIDVVVKQNDEIDIAGIEALNPEMLFLSPGPCTPADAGITLQAISHFAGKLPILGVCLGHEAIGQAFGAKVVKAKQVMHGKTSPVHHRGEGVFRNLPSPYTATRYHSLVLDQASLPECLDVTAWTENDDGSLDEIMAVRHKEYAIEGVQFHPESVLTEHGMALLTNFVHSARRQTEKE